ncbi:MAG TPA: metallopeptidase family protein, partial [Polyangiaceae bacterium]|nr:metallopeptidase family protein [Polyangiaceae bacterium]
GGFDPRALALFEGPSADASAENEPPAPTRIVLYTANLPAEFEDEEELASEVELTLLQEIGNYFGLEDDELDRLGLE